MLCLLPVSPSLVPRVLGDFKFCLWDCKPSLVFLARIVTVSQSKRSMGPTLFNPVPPITSSVCPRVTHLCLIVTSDFKQFRCVWEMPTNFLSLKSFPRTLWKLWMAFAPWIWKPQLVFTSDLMHRLAMNKTQLKLFHLNMSQTVLAVTLVRTRLAVFRSS